MILLLLCLLWDLATFIFAKLAKFASNNKKKKLPEGPIHLPVENMVDIFAFISRPQIDQCELVNQRFRAIIERHKNKLPTLKLEEQNKCRKEAYIRWKSGLTCAKAMLIMDIFFAIHWIMMEFFKETDLVNANLLYSIFIPLFWGCAVCWAKKGVFDVYYCFYFFEMIFQALIIPSLLLIYTNQLYLKSILSTIYLAFLFPLILFQSHNLYKMQYFDCPPQCQKKQD